MNIICVKQLHKLNILYPKFASKFDQLIPQNFTTQIAKNKIHRATYNESFIQEFCFFFQIEGHTLKLLASDSFEFRPVFTDALVSTSGERYDFVPVLKNFTARSKFLTFISWIFFDIVKMSKFLALGLTGSGNGCKTLFLNVSNKIFF